jgi:hypothetical protein
MIRWTGLAWAIALFIFTFTGCAVSTEPDEARLGTATQDWMPMNGLSPKALMPKTLDLRALRAHPLALGELHHGVLAAIRDPGADGDLARQHLEYTVGCALDGAQSLSFSWTDARRVRHDETYQGSVGLATHWATRPLSAEGQRWVSACLAARTNDFGVHVQISTRAAHGTLSRISAYEAATYTTQEGAFWGDLYGRAPALYACHVAANDANSRSELRDCAAGYLDPNTGAIASCGMIQILGTCDELCLPLDGEPGHPACWADPAHSSQATFEPITVMLP